MAHSDDHARHDRRNDERRLGVAALLTGGFMLAEVAGGLIAGSLALLADAGHMLTDFAGLALAWFGFRLARRPADWRRTYGFDRFSVLVAFVNGISLFAIAAVIAVEAYHRLRAPTPVDAETMLWVAAGGLLVNIAAFLILRGGQHGHGHSHGHDHADEHATHGNLNMRAAFLHVLGDLLGSAAAIAGAIIILLTGWTAVDPLLSLLVTLIILRSGWGVVRDSGHILLEGSPAGLDVRELEADLVRTVPGVVDVHHVHAWSISEERAMATLHARLDGGGDPGAAILAIKARLRSRFGIGHATVEVEESVCADHLTAKERAAADHAGSEITEPG